MVFGWGWQWWRPSCGHFVHGKPISGDWAMDWDLPERKTTIYPCAESAEWLLNGIQRFKIDFLAPFCRDAPHRQLNPYVLALLSSL